MLYFLIDVTFLIFIVREETLCSKYSRQLKHKVKFQLNHYTRGGS